MIKNNKNAPTTLYLLNSKIKFEEQKKSARPSINQKKSTRSISQFAKWGKETSPFKYSKDNSSLKKIILSKNKYSMEPLQIDKKLHQLNRIFGEENIHKHSKTSSQTSKFIENSQKQASNIKMLKKNESLLNAEYEQTIQTVVNKINKKFKKYYLITQQRRERYIHQEIDYIIDDLISNFKQLFSQVCSIYNRQIISNIQFFQNQIISVSKDYQIQIQSLRKQLVQSTFQKSTINNMLNEINLLRKRGVLNSKIFNELSQQGIDIQNWIKNSKTFQQLQNNPNFANTQYKQQEQQDKSYKQKYLHRQQQYAKISKKPYELQYEKVQNKKTQNIDSSLNINISSIAKKQQYSRIQQKNHEIYKKLNSYR